MKTTITEHGAAVMVLDSIFKQVDAKFVDVWNNLNKLLAQAGSPPLNQNFAQFAFTIGVSAVNLRAAYDVLPREKAERIFVHTMRLFEMQLKNPQHLAAVTNSIRKYINAYNEGIAAIKNPMDNVAHYLYYSLGLKNINGIHGGQKVSGPDPNVVQYLSTAMIFFTGKWEAMNNKFDILEPES